MNKNVHFRAQIPFDVGNYHIIYLQVNACLDMLG